MNNTIEPYTFANDCDGNYPENLAEHTIIQSSSLNCPLFCAKCYQTFGLEELSDTESKFERDDDTDLSSSDDSLTPIFREDPEDVEERILEEIDLYITENPLRISKPNVEKEIAQEIAAVLFEEWLEEDLCEESDLPEIREWIQNMVDVYFDCNATIPPRQGGVATEYTPLRKASLEKKMRAISAIRYPPQRTQEWYEMRFNLITASNLWKALGTESQQNQLIVEKCQSFDQFKEDCARIASGQGQINSDNPMAWGQKYEPITALLYQQKNNTTLGEYGCIVHPDYPFIGASPDGINVDSASPLYGRMLEIKNIVNREIDGVPSLAYWIQTQIQMEVCDLDECDFVETRFKECASKTEWMESAAEHKGAILQFVPRVTIEQTMAGIEQTMARKHAHSSDQITEYYIVSEEENIEAFDAWLQQKKQEHAGYVLSNTIYWFLDQYSCVLIKRNCNWFKAALPKLEAIWQTIVKERISGCEHRAPKKRQPKSTSPPDITITKMD